LIDDAGAELNRLCSNIVDEYTLMNPFSAAWMVGWEVRDLILQAR